MAAGYDEWAAARTPSLLAFASALLDDDQAVVAAVSRALARTRAAWARVSRDDPDLEARRHVVRACSAPRRAAVVLRVLEERSDAEIAEVVRCSEAAVRRHLERGFADLDPGSPAAEPQAGVRERLVARAGSAPTQLLTREPASGPATEPRRRHRGSWLAALAVLALVGGVAYIAHASQTDGYPRVDVPESWRYESYAGVQLQVPDTWGWGASPVRSAIFSGRRHLGSCGTNQAAVLSPTDDSAYVSTLTPFVGRPAVVTHRCMSWGSAGTMPLAQAVWFDSPFAVGVKPRGPTVAETRVVGGQHVTVFAPDPSVRHQILGSVEEVGDIDANGCPTDAIAGPVAGAADLEPESLSVCVYSQDTGVATLMYSGRLTDGTARQYVAHVAAGSSRTDTSDRSCPTPTGRWIALGVNGDGDTRWDVVNVGCDRIVMTDGRSAVLTPETARDWAVGGVTAYVSAPRDGDRALGDYFRAPAS